MRTRAQAADPAALDLAYLSATYGVAEPELQALLDAPTTDLARSVLAALATKGPDFDALRADKLKADVELENNVRTAEAKVKAQRAQVTKHAQELAEVRTRLGAAEGAREALATELEQLRASTAGGAAETQALRQRIETLEASNRDALALVESKAVEKDRLAGELAEQHGKLRALRREVGELEERCQSLENAASAQKFREQSLQQEVELLKKNNEWHSAELQTRTQEHARFRKERNARIAGLQRELEDSTATVDALTRSEAALRQRLDEVQAKADEAFARNASLQEAAARKEQDFRTELDSSKRLAELQAQSAQTHKDRLHEVQRHLEQIKDDAAEEIGRLQAEVETERVDKDAAERRIAELELEAERLEQQQPVRTPRPGTPVMRNGGWDPSTPTRLGSRAASPSAMPGSMRKSVNGLSFTQLYAQYAEKEKELATERARTNKLSSTLDELVTQLENQSPEVLAMKEEHEKLEQQVLDFSTMIDDANQTRENAVKEAQHWQNEAAATAREGDILRQQLRDLSAQVKMLLVELQSRDQGLGEMSATERIELERAARGELTGDALDHMTDTGRFIAERLVIFRDVSDLQEKNQQMLRLVETLGDQLEGEEAQEKERQTEAYRSENEELKLQIRRLKDELQATVTQIDSYMKERDMFRRMLQHRGQLPAEGDLQSVFGQSVGPPATPLRNGQSLLEPPTPRSRDVEDLNKLLKEQQTFFDQYRNESAEDRRMLKGQVDTLVREKSTLQTDLARAQSQLTLASERYEMLQSNFTALRNENSELGKRSRDMAEQAAKQDLRTQQVAEELVEARSMAESLRNENANAKAEKELWKRIETRLTEDSKGLMDERSRLSKLVTDLQNLQNERELADSETRRRLQSRTESLETELTEAKKKLELEAEESRKAALRREYEEGQSRTRIDDLVKSLGNVREELVAAKTTRDQLQARVDEMKIELRAAEEKLTALHPRPTPRAEPAASNGEVEELPAEQRLALEVSELRRDLEFSRNELEAARREVEQYRSIAQTTEEELASFNETFEQYKEETESLITEKDSRVKELEQRIEDLSNELATTNNENSELRSKQEDAAHAVAEQKANFESELAQLKDDNERHAAEKKLYQEDLRAQAEIAQQAQQSYENELLKHAEAAKSLQVVRQEHNELRTEVAGIRAEAEAAKVSLERGEESWAEQKERFERELEEVQRRRADVDKQNKLLHQQMESFSTELAGLRQGRALPSAEGTGEEASAGSPSRISEGNLQEVISFLRREKEIVDVQWELSIQESKRLQQQLDYANGQLEETRTKLAEERRQAAHNIAAEGSTNKLMQTINELNLFRESATTLRNEARQARERLEEKTRDVERLVAEMEPLKGRVGDLEGELEAKEGELKLLQEDRDHWRERTQNIISKYDRVDPAELESLKSQLETLKAENERLETEHAQSASTFETQMQDKVDELNKERDERIAKVRQQAKDRDAKQNADKRQLNEHLSAVKAELEGVKAELETTKVALQEAQSKGGSGAAEEGELQENGEGADHTALQARIAEAESNAAVHASRAEELSGHTAVLQSQVEELEGQVAELTQQLETSRQTASERQEQSVQNEGPETLEKLRRDLATAQREAEALQAKAAGQTPAATSDQTMADVHSHEGGLEKSVPQQIAEAVAKLREELTAQHELSIKLLTEEHDRKTDILKANLRRQLAEERNKFKEQGKQELITQHSAELQKLRDDHEVAVAQVKEGHQAELEKLARDGNVAVQNAAEGAADTVKPEADKAPDLTDAQVMDLIKHNDRVKAILRNNITKSAAQQTEKLTKAIAEKDEEITRLKAAHGSEGTTASAPISDADKSALEKKIEELQKEKTELTSRLDSLQKEKDNLDKQVKELKTAEMKSKIMVGQFPMLQGKLQIVTKAAQETPDKPVVEVYEVVKTFKPAPKSGQPAAGAAGSPAAKPTAPTSASPAQAKATQSPVVQQRPPEQPPLHQTTTAELSEAEKLKKRQERFGIAAAATQGQIAQTTGTFGQPSVPVQTGPSTSEQPSATSTFGQPSHPPQQGAAAQSARRPSAQAGNTGEVGGVPPNPQAAPFTPIESNTQSSLPRPNTGTGTAHRSLSSGIPRGGSNLPRGGAAPAGRGGISIQGAAAPVTQNQPTGTQRGGIQSGLPRGGGNVARGAGRGGARGGAANAGQKRPHDGGEGTGGDGKRMRGGGGAS